MGVLLSWSPGSVGSVVRVGSPAVSLLVVWVVCCPWFVPSCSPLPFSVTQERAATQEPTNFPTGSDDPADWHRPENRNFFRYLQRESPRQSACWRVSSWKDWYGILVLRFLVCTFVEVGSAVNRFSTHSGRPFAVVDVDVLSRQPCQLQFRPRR